MKKAILKGITVFFITLIMIGTSYASYKLGVQNGIEQGFQKGKQEVKTVIPDGYIKLTDCVPLEDICAKFTDEYDYQCLIIGDYGKQLDNPDNMPYEEVLKDIPDETEEYRNNMVNMSEVVDYDATESGLYLYMENGDKYYWESK